MSLYNIVHGENPFAVVLLGMLGLRRTDVPRYRDCWWDGNRIVVYTRTGGGNREYYDEKKGLEANDAVFNDDLRALPTFIKDEDDSFDCTYAKFYFSVPPKLAWVIPQLTAQEVEPAERWKSFMARMQDPASKDDPDIQRVVAAMAPILEGIAAHLKEK